MSLFHRINALKFKHAHLEKSIEREQRRPLPNLNILHHLKREKLSLKEEILKLSIFA